MATRTAKTRQENEEITNHPKTASLKGRHRLYVCSQKTGRRALMKAEEAYTAKITRVIEYVDRM
jgi:hypothetical protein